jgi:hypothetical protein
LHDCRTYEGATRPTPLLDRHEVQPSRLDHTTEREPIRIIGAAGQPRGDLPVDRRRLAQAFGCRANMEYLLLATCG